MCVTKKRKRRMFRDGEYAGAGTRIVHVEFQAKVVNDACGAIM